MRTVRDLLEGRGMQAVDPLTTRIENGVARWRSAVENAVVDAVEAEGKRLGFTVGSADASINAHQQGCVGVICDMSHSSRKFEVNILLAEPLLEAHSGVPEQRALFIAGNERVDMKGPGAQSSLNTGASMVAMFKAYLQQAIRLAQQRGLV